MSLYSKQQIFCNACGKECFTEIPGGMMGGKFLGYIVCSMECVKEMRLREASSILGKEYSSSPTIKVGSHVIDNDGNEGIVVKLIPGNSIENHGSIFVWQINRTEYGADNCEHYCYFNWNYSLKIL